MMNWDTEIDLTPPTRFEWQVRLTGVWFDWQVGWGPEGAGHGDDSTEGEAGPASGGGGQDRGAPGHLRQQRARETEAGAQHRHHRRAAQEGRQTHHRTRWWADPLGRNRQGGDLYWFVRGDIKTYKLIGIGGGIV